MASVLQLQKLNVTSNLDEMHIVLISTYSGICPATGNSADAQRFELE